jgi:hypothetical protein
MGEDKLRMRLKRNERHTASCVPLGSTNTTVGDASSG